MGKGGFKTFLGGEVRILIPPFNNKSKKKGMEELVQI
jgi:hypothetical protein